MLAFPPNSTVIMTNILEFSSLNSSQDTLLHIRTRMSRTGAIDKRFFINLISSKPHLKSIIFIQFGLGSI